ncbi:chromosome transmission fidelity protein 8 homolog [Montipora capricornis]|uniref:chromosome transmission fidelity protein 8 homolog n=1 Tax=Montipora foliosa TaxID=591990 RepID=UPI0035F1FCDB
MVQIMISMAPDVSDWIIIELQGTLETKEDVSLEGKCIGDLHFDAKGTPMLIIGHHLLHGKVMDLDKPYAVLHKKSNVLENDSSRKGDTHYNICALVKKKIIFKTRPKPIVLKNVPITR